MRSEVEEDVGLRLTHSAGRQPRGNDIVFVSRRVTVSAQGLPILGLTAGVLEVIVDIGYSKHTIYIPLIKTMALFLPLRGS